MLSVRKEKDLYTIECTRATSPTSKYFWKQPCPSRKTERWYECGKRKERKKDRGEGETQRQETVVRAAFK